MPIYKISLLINFKNYYHLSVENMGFQKNGENEYKQNID